MNIYHSHPQALFLLLISIFLYFNPAITLGVTEDAPEEKDSEEFENSLVTNVRNNYQNGFVELLNFIDSLNNTLIALNKKLAAQDTAFATLNAKIDAQKVELLNTLNERLSTQDLHFAVLTPKLARLSQKTNLLLKTAFPNLNTWEGVDRLIRNQAGEITTGKSFNGSTLSDIKSRAAHIGGNGWYTAIVVVNHLDEAIGDFKIHRAFYNASMYNPAPNSVSGLTQEVFTLAFPAINRGAPHGSFSYVIPSLDIRIAAISKAGAYCAGLAFVSKETDMQTYYKSEKGITGSFVYECCGNVDRNLSVSYKNFFAKMFADSEGDGQATLRIELTKLLLDD